jgi:DNA repair protein RecN (Recombination protein N)
MLSLLKIKNIALIDELEIEFGGGLNLLTGETGSGKSIIVAALGALTGERVSSDIIKDGAASARIEGLFTVRKPRALIQILDEGGIETDGEDAIELIVRRELSAGGKNRVFVNDQLVTMSLLKKIGMHLADIHGQGEQAALYDVSTHIDMLDEYAATAVLKRNTAEAFHHWSVTRTELGMLQQNENEKLQLLDVLKFQVDEIKRSGIAVGEDEQLEEEKRRLNNIEKLSALSRDVYAFLYDNAESAFDLLEKAKRAADELAEYESKFGEYKESLESAIAVTEDLAAAARDYLSHLEFSPARLEEIESRLSEISRLKRKYGETIADVLAHLHTAEERLKNVESAEFREEELRRLLAERRRDYITAASLLHDKRSAAAKKFEKQVMHDLKAVALDKARFEVRIAAPSAADLEDEGADQYFTANGFDRVEFYFSANPGESPKALAKVASGGEASRVMLVLKTAAHSNDPNKSAVFDEVDSGIGGRVAEAVGLKLKALAETQQVLCVTHQPQIASLADTHFIVEKSVVKNRTGITVRALDANGRIEEIARMLAGETISETARDHARELLAATN